MPARLVVAEIEEAIRHAEAAYGQAVDPFAALAVERYLIQLRKKLTRARQSATQKANFQAAKAEREAS